MGAESSVASMDSKTILHSAALFSFERLTSKQIIMSMANHGEWLGFRSPPARTSDPRRRPEGTAALVSVTIRDRRPRALRATAATGFLFAGPLLKAAGQPVSAYEPDLFAFSIGKYFVVTIRQRFRNVED
jgi:hypothetical protein